MVQGWSQDHGVSDSHRCHARVPRGTLHAAVSRVDVPGHGARSSTGVNKSGLDLVYVAIYGGERRRWHKNRYFEMCWQNLTVMQERLPVFFF